MHFKSVCFALIEVDYAIRSIYMIDLYMYRYTQLCSVYVLCVIYSYGYNKKTRLMQDLQDDM